MKRTFAIAALLLSFGAAAGEPTLKPFVLAAREQGEVEAVAAATKA